MAASASTAVLRSEARLFGREPGSVFWIVVFPSLLLVILGSIPSFRHPEASIGGSRVIDLYVPIAVLLAMIMAGLQAMPPVLTGYRERGILRRMSTTPVRPTSLLSAQIALHAAAALCSVVLVIVIGRVGFHVRLPQQFGGYLLALLLAVLSALAMGATVCAFSPTTKIANAVGTGFFFPMMFTAGLWLPVQEMPDLLRRIVECTPFGAAARALDQAATGHWPQWSHLGVMALWVGVLIAVATRWFKWE